MSMHLPKPCTIWTRPARSMMSHLIYERGSRRTPHGNLQSLSVCFQEFPRTLCWLAKDEISGGFHPVYQISWCPDSVMTGHEPHPFRRS